MSLLMVIVDTMIYLYTRPGLVIHPLLWLDWQGFDNLRKPSSGAPPQWIMRSVGDR